VHAGSHPFSVVPGFMPSAHINSLGMQLLRLQRLVWVTPLLVGAAASLDPGPSPLTPKQMKRIDEVRAAAIPASREAESWLLQHFQSAGFRAGLLLQGDLELAAASSEQLLSQLKDTLGSMEYVTNFGVEAAYRREHPGDSGMDLKTLEQFGHIPTMWELKAVNSSLVNGTPADEWAILDAAETGLYGLPAFSDPAPQGPSAEEGRERPQYLSTNLRRLDVGVARYGPYMAVVRQSVVRERLLVIGSDSGGWENGCNSSITPVKKWFPPLSHIFAKCKGIFDFGQGHPGVGMLDHQLHTLVGNSAIFENSGGTLPRLVYQMLSPTATLRPLETLMYTEGGMLGPLRMQDMKLIVASLPGLFGSDESDELRAFCKRHGVPLAWAIGNAQSWMSEDMHKLEWLPYAPVYWPEGQERLLDPISWDLTNATAPAGLRAIEAAWHMIEDEVRARREQYWGKGLHIKRHISQIEYLGWWARLTRLGGAVRAVRGRECSELDLCFGTLAETGTRDCVCRLPPEAPPESSLIV